MKTALRLSVPAGRVDVWVCACPLVTVTRLPMSVVPTSNWTVPGAADGVTVAVRVSWVPNSWGLAGDAFSVVGRCHGFTVNDSVPVDPA